MELSTYSLYTESCGALELYQEKQIEYNKAVHAIVLKEINLDSVRAQVTAELEGSAVSKTALKELVAGDKRVMEAKGDLLKKKANKEQYAASMVYLKMKADLNKKMMGSLDIDKQIFGG